MTPGMSSNFVVLAGGYDLEMVTIINLCRENGIEVVDKFLGWGESSAVHADAVAQVQKEGKQVVFIEPIFDDSFPQPEGSIVIDHHGERSHEEPSLIQFLKLIGLEPTRRQRLIGANDAGYIPAMLAMGATEAEISEIRRMDREAQGVTEEMEAEAERAISEKEIVNGVTIVKMAHSKTATVCDRLFNPAEKQNLLILSGDGEVNYFGNGALCAVLKEKFEGWNGGSGLGDAEGTAFWGGYPNQDEVVRFITGVLAIAGVFVEAAKRAETCCHNVNVNVTIRYEMQKPDYDDFDRCASGH